MDNTLRTILNGMDAPELIELISEASEHLAPLIERDRPFKGARDENHETDERVRYWHVPSTTSGYYTVFFDPTEEDETNRWRCTCPSSLFRRDELCKHIRRVEQAPHVGTFTYREFRKQLDRAYEEQKST